MIDIGEGTTGIVVFEDGNLLMSKVLPIGGGHVTNDLVYAMRVPIEDAEKIKIQYGTALPGEVSESDKVDLTKYGEAEEDSISRKHLARIIESRMSEIFSLIDKELKSIGKSGKLPAGAVLTGGGAKLPGVIDVAKSELKLPAQLGFPAEIPIATGSVESTDAATVVGLLLWGIDALRGNDGAHTSDDASSVSDTVGKMKKWFKTFLP